jgi:hypothetical protein
MLAGANGSPGDLTLGNKSGNAWYLDLVRLTPLLECTRGRREIKIGPVAVDNL